MKQKSTLLSLGCIILAATLLLGCTMPAPISATLPARLPSPAPGEETLSAGEREADDLATQEAENGEALQPSVEASEEAAVTAPPAVLPESLPATSTPEGVAAATPIPEGAVAATPIPSELLAERAQFASRFVAQVGTPARTSNFVRPDLGCNYLGVGGQVFNLDGAAVTGLIIEVRGTLGGQAVLKLGLTGGAVALGPGGYEIMVADRPAAASQALTVQLFDVSGVPISEPVAFDTSQRCEENLVVINFREERILTPLFLPFVANNQFMDTFLPNITR